MRTIALFLAALLLTSACTDDPEPIEPSRTESPTAEPSRSTLPEVAMERNPDGAIAFARHWLEAFNFAVNTGDIKTFSKLNERGCEGCKSYEEEINRLNRDGAEVRNFRWTAEKATLTEDQRLEASIRSQDYEVRDSRSDNWSKVPGAQQQIGFALSWKNRTWKVRELYLPEES